MNIFSDYFKGFKINLIGYSILLSISVELIIGCKKEELQNPPVVVTISASDVKLSSVKLNGEVIDEGFSPTTSRGFVYSIYNINPTINDTKVQSLYGKGVFSVFLEKLTPNTKYYFNAYATNSKSTTYGIVQSVITEDYKLPTVVTDLPINSTFFSVEVAGSIKDSGGLMIVESGFCYGLLPSPTISDNRVILKEVLGVFTTSIYNLKDNSKYYVRAYAINSKGTSYGNEQFFQTLAAPITPRDSTTKVVEIKSKTGRIWMDRNLGAIQVATSPNDEKAYGDLYQWGRLADGHQKRDSPNTTTLSTSDQPGNGNFIISKSSIDWRTPRNGNLWQGVNGVNNPCPIGYRIPTIEEWDLERLSWSSSNYNGAFNSTLKLPNAGYRSFDFYNPSVVSPGNGGAYWSSTEDFNKVDSYVLYFGNDANKSYSNRAVGHSVRCIKD